MAKTKYIPPSGLQGLTKYWRSDLIAAFSVALVALPLSLGIAIASGVPPMAGLISCIVGGVITTFYRGSHLGINGPAAGLIAVVLGGMISLEDGSGRTWQYVLAAVVISGAIQVVQGLFKLGKFADAIPAAVIHGILAAIGVIIFAKQIHVALGVEVDAASTFGVLLAIPESILQLNPFVTIISVLSMLLLIFHAKISYKLFHFVPAPVWVVVIAVPLAMLFGFSQTQQLSFLGKAYPVGPELLIDIPNKVLDSLILPDFSRIAEGKFWLLVISLNLIASLETLAIGKAVDKLDPFKRRTNVNKDLIGVGLANVVAGCIGGLPIITVIVRSSVNINNGAKTRWSNLYYGIIILLFVLLFSSFLQNIPLAALAAILVYTGFKLASPTVFKHALNQGIEQFLFLTTTLIVTLFTDLLWGIISGILMTILVQMLLSRLPATVFFQYIRKPHFQHKQLGAKRHEVEVKGIAGFMTLLPLQRVLEAIPAKENLMVNFSQTRLVDLTMQEFVDDFGERYEEDGGTFAVEGLEYHSTSSPHPYALKSLPTKVPARLTPRQQHLKELAIEHDWQYRAEVDWNTSYLKHFHFFETRPIEYKTNVINGAYPALDIHFEISDLTFDEGAFMAKEVYKTTVEVIRLPFEIPAFILEKEGLFEKVFDRVRAFTGDEDIDFDEFSDFSKKFMLHADDEAAVRQFFQPGLLHFFEQEDIYHIESNGEALLIFKYLRLARTEEAAKMLDFAKRLLQQLRVCLNFYRSDNQHFTNLTSTK